MKKFLLITLSCLLFACMLPSALANEWGLRGGIYDIVSDDDRYDGYSAVADDGNKGQNGVHVNHAVMENRYHAVLIAAIREGKVWEAEVVSTTAVFQPGSVPEGLPAHPTLTHRDGGFVLSYGGKEVYTFLRDEDGRYTLHRAEFKQEDETYINSLMEQPEGMMFWQSGPANEFVPVGDALWTRSAVLLEDFNIAQTPRSMAEVRRLSQVGAVLDGAAPALEALGQRTGNKTGKTVPVYAAPDKAAYRSANGKASVSLKEDVTVYGTVDGWTLVSYEVSPRTSRFGYILGDEAAGAELVFGQVALVAAADTFLTDDPFVSQYAQAEIPKGTALTGLARCGAYYAYCEVTLGGKTYRGFVPLKDLDTKSDHPISLWADVEDGTAPLSADVCWDVMDTLVGKWSPVNSDDSTRLVLFCGGEYRHHKPGDGAHYREVGCYRVYATDGGYEIYFLPEATGEDICERTQLLTLNSNGTITVDGIVYDREEYSTYGNG